jgi:hypothetical protein
MEDGMAEEAPRRSGWLKTVGGTLAGVLSGAVVMYLTPLVDRVVKPSKPLANFAEEHEGLNVTFHNRSIGGRDGWWDFGDGTPLERLNPQQDIVTHKYPRPGDYVAKLTLQNLLGDDDVRSVTIQLDAGRVEPPEILSLDADPVDPNSSAPATFHLTCKSKNAQLYIWDTGDNRPLEITQDNGSGTEIRTVSFWKPGTYTVKVAGVNGTHADQRSKILVVNEPRAGSVTVSLHATDQATHLQTIRVPLTFQDTFPITLAGDIYHFTHQAPAKPGYLITDVHFKSADGPGLQGQTVVDIDPLAAGVPGVQNLRIQLAPDRRSVALSGDMMRPVSSGQADQSAPVITVPVVFYEEKRSKADRPAVAVTSTVSLPGSAMLGLPPLPSGWVDAQRQIQVEILDGEKVIWQSSQLPVNTTISIRDRSYSLSALLDGSQVHFDLTEPRSGSAAAPTATVPHP